MAEGPVATFLWRHLHYEGHDICRLYRRPAGWLLEGYSEFTDGSRSSRLVYMIATDLRMYQNSSAPSSGVRSGRISCRSALASVSSASVAKALA